MILKEADILIIGSGLAGAISALTAAEENKKVILITKSKTLLSGNTKWAQGGIAYTNSNDSEEKFIKDISVAGHKHNNDSAVQQLVKEGPKLVERLLINKLRFLLKKIQVETFYTLLRQHTQQTE